MGRAILGKRKYRCADCGHERMYYPCEFRCGQTGRVHCDGCGGTFLEPKSPAAKAEEVKTSILRSELKPTKFMGLSGVLVRSSEASHNDANHEGSGLARHKGRSGRG